MATSYHVYRNDGQGGPIDYDHPIATVGADPADPTAGLTFTPGPLLRPSDNLFAVRAFDDVSGIEEANTDARVRLILDAAGVDVSSRPGPVVGLAARWSLGDEALVSWGYQAAGRGGPPARFDLFVEPIGVDHPADPAVGRSPAQSVSFNSGVAGFGCRLRGLTRTSAWTVRVRAVGVAGIAGPPVSASLGAQGGTLAAVDALRAIATP